MTPSPSTLDENATATQAAQLMREQGIGSVIVKRIDGRLCGIVTDRDLVIRCLASGDPDAGQMALSKLCTTEPRQLEPDADAEEAIRIMGQAKIHRLPVVENGSAIGVLSLGDLAVQRDPESLLGQISAASSDNA